MEKGTYPLADRLALIDSELRTPRPLAHPNVVLGEEATALHHLGDPAPHDLAVLLLIARDPAAFLEMWNTAPFMAWRVNGALKLEWANPAYLSALEAKSLDQAIAELSADGQVIQLRKLPPRFHRQPEGVTALIDGTLIISDEGTSQIPPRLTLYSCER